jgi:hypothetical protein
LSADSSSSLLRASIPSTPITCSSRTAVGPYLFLPSLYARLTRSAFSPSAIITGDDCVSTKGNSTNISVRNLYCEGTHGVSIGSLAQYVVGRLSSRFRQARRKLRVHSSLNPFSPRFTQGVHDYVNGIYVRNVTFNGGENAIRQSPALVVGSRSRRHDLTSLTFLPARPLTGIKVWPASPEHGSAHVENVFYKNVTTWNVDTPIFVRPSSMFLSYAARRVTNNIIAGVSK